MDADFDAHAVACRARGARRGWPADGTAVFVRTKSPPVEIRRVDIATGAASPVCDVRPPPVGLSGVLALTTSAAGDAYAYSYIDEASRLYRMTT